MLHGAPDPQRRGLLILRHADTLALEVGRLVDLGILPHQDARVKEHPRGEHRNADEAVVALRFRHHQRRHRHLGDVELGKPQLPPEQLGRMQHRRREIDALDLHRAVDDRPGARIGGDADAELDCHVSLFSLNVPDWIRTRCRSSPRTRGPSLCSRTGFPLRGNERSVLQRDVSIKREFTSSCCGNPASASRETPGRPPSIPRCRRTAPAPRSRARRWRAGSRCRR